jgi:hypothetical protein
VLALVRGLVAVAAAVAVASLTGAAEAADWSCGAQPDTSGATKAVFGHTATKAGASALARRVRRGFKFVEVEHVGCGVWQVAVAGLNTPRQQREFAEEAEQVGFPGVTFQGSADVTMPSAPGTVKAVFGTYNELAPADRMLRRVARFGFRLAAIGRYGVRSFKVLLVGVPLSATQEFAKQARSAGLPLTYEVG